MTAVTMDQKMNLGVEPAVRARRASLVWQPAMPDATRKMTAEGAVLGYRIEGPAVPGGPVHVSLTLQGEVVGTIECGSIPSARKACAAYERALVAAHKDAMAYMFVRLHHHLAKTSRVRRSRSRGSNRRLTATAAD